MKSRFKLFQSVVAARDFTEAELMGAPGRGKRAIIDGKPGVRKGTRGAIVEIFEDAGDIGVEFFDEGETIDVAFVPEAYVAAAPDESVKSTRETQPRGRITKR